MALEQRPAVDSDNGRKTPLSLAPPRTTTAGYSGPSDLWIVNKQASTTRFRSSNG